MRTPPSSHREMSRQRQGVPAEVIATVSGGILLTCLTLCAGLITFLAYVGTAQEPAAQAASPDKKESGARQSHPVGFRKMTFTYRRGKGPAIDRQVLLWYPATGTDKPFDYNGQKGFATLDAPVAPGAHPLILFSHGFLGCADQTIFLMEAFAREGYIVAAVNHADASNQKRQKPVEWPNFINTKSWDETKYRDRRDDLVALIDHLLGLDQRNGSFLHRHIDRKVIGAAGHSLGGYTILGMIGGWRSWREPRLRAALLLSPYALPYLRGNNLRSIRTPVMLQGGTLDLGITPFLPGVYRPLQGPKYYLVLKNETHFGWTNLISLGKTTTDCVKRGNARHMAEYSLAFFHHHLRGQAAPLLKTKADGVDSYRFDEETRR